MQHERPGFFSAKGFDPLFIGPGAQGQDAHDLGFAACEEG